MPCPECDWLRAESERLERLLAQAVSALTESTGTAIATNYEQFRVAAADARIDSEVARLELQRHRRYCRKD